MSVRFYGGQPVGMGNAGAVAGGNFMGAPGSAINPEAFRKDARQQKIYNKGQGTDNPNEKEIFLQRTGPRLPFAGTPSPGGSPYSEMPKEYLEQRNPFGAPVPPTSPQQSPQPGFPVQLELPLAAGSSNLPAAIGNMAGLANSQFYRGPQLGQAGLYFGGVM